MIVENAAWLISCLPERMTEYARWLRRNGWTEPAVLDMVRVWNKHQAEPWEDDKGLVAGIGAIFGDEEAVSNSRPLLDIFIDTPVREKIPTGLPTFDRLTAGGLTRGKLTVIVGAPSAAKTALVHRFAAAATSAEIFAPDDGDEVTTERYALLGGADPKDPVTAEPTELWAKPHEILARPRDANPRPKPVDLSPRRPSVAAALAKFGGIRVARDDETLAEFCRRPATLAAPLVVVDSIHAGAEDLEGESEQERIKAAVKLVRQLASSGPAVVITAESNRGAYASRDLRKRTDAMASGAETRKLEYTAGVLLFLENREGTILAQLRKNKCGGQTGSFALRLDKISLELKEIDAAVALDERDRAKAKKSADLERRILGVLREHGQVTGNQLKQFVGGNAIEYAAVRDTLAAAGKIVGSPAPRNGTYWRLAGQQLDLAAR
jgi:hypothetical protein